MENFQEFINQFSALSKVDADRLFKTFEYETFPKSTLILEPGKRAHYLYFIEKGLVRTFFNNAKGRNTTTSFFKEKEIFTSADSFFNQTVSNLGVETLEDVELMKITHQSLEDLCQEYPSLDKIKFDLLLFFYNKTSHRLMSSFTMTAKERYQSLLDEVPEILNRASLGHIASYLGISQETLSRIRSNY